MDRMGELDTDPRRPPRDLGIRPVHRRARPARHQGRRQVGRVDRRPLEVRPHHGRDRGRRRAPARGGHARLPAAAALPHRLADHRHPRDQGRAARGRAASSSSCTRLGADMRFLDCGGGLGVDYDGSQTNFHSSVNYTLQEYANDIVSQVAEACNARGVPHPDIVTESGRALVAHHSVLVFNVLGDQRDPGRPGARRRRRHDEHHGHPAARRDLRRASRARTSRRPTTTRCSSRRRRSPPSTSGYLDLQGARARRAAVLGGAASGS